LKKQYCVYLLTNRVNTVIYTGVTSGLKARVRIHKDKLVEGFTSRYGVDRLVYYEVFDDVVNAIAREKQIKAGSRKKKMELIDAFNPTWRDLYDEL
jgi:putative endonuclease